MPRVTLTLNDAVYRELERYASRAGMGVDEFLTQGIHQHAAQLLPTPPKAWMPRERWDALMHGEHCPLCADVASNELANKDGYLVADLDMSRLRLALNQYAAGYCVLICKKHAPELYHLTLEERSMYIEDMVRSAQALEEVFHPVKVNFQLLGNAVPHLHCHIILRFYGDASPGKPLDPNLGTHLLSEQEYEERVNSIRAEL